MLRTVLIWWITLGQGFLTLEEPQLRGSLGDAPQPFSNEEPNQMCIFRASRANLLLDGRRWPVSFAN